MTGLTRWRLVIYMVALFVAGGITGAAVMSHLNVPASQSLKLGRADEIAASISEKLNTRLDLTADQKEKFKPLIKRASEELEASHADCLKRISAAIDMLHVQMAPELSSDQKEKLKVLESERVKSMQTKYNYTLDPARTNAP
jgi:actin-like ATPase involved in cell morphogenesis